jgi:hypothetical protein
MAGGSNAHPENGDTVCHNIIRQLAAVRGAFNSLMIQHFKGYLERGMLRVLRGGSADPCAAAVSPVNRGPHRSSSSGTRAYCGRLSRLVPSLQQVLAERSEAGE